MFAVPRAPLAGESGGRTDVRWLSLTDPASGGGLLAAAAGAGQALQASVSPYSVRSFEAAAHDHQLEVRALVAEWCCRLPCHARSMLHSHAAPLS